MRWLILIGALLVGLSFVAVASAGTRSPVPKLAAAGPQGPCDEDHVTDIEIIDGVWFECVCEQRMFTKPTCDWYEITSPAHDPTQLRKWLRRHPKFAPRITVVSWAVRP